MASPRHSTTMENLPVEVLSDIFIRLLAKQLAQMRCVCKSINVLLSGSSFVKSHLNRSMHNNDETLMFFSQGFSFERSLFGTHPTTSPDSEPTNFIKLPVEPQPNNSYGRVIGSVNGLICFCYRSYSLPHNNCVVYIWNPSLSAVLTLPLSSLTVSDLMKLHLRFGYDSKTDDYKVVKLTTISGSTLALVYSMRKGSWEVISQRFPCQVTLIRHDDEVCVNDHVHWLCYTDPTYESQTMVAFDLSAETFREIPLPESISRDHGYRFNKFSALGGKLCAVSRVRDGGECEVWVMDEYGVTESWVKHHVFSQFSGDIVTYGFTSRWQE